MDVTHSTIALRIALELMISLCVSPTDFAFATVVTSTSSQTMHRVSSVFSKRCCLMSLIKLLVSRRHVVEVSYDKSRRVGRLNKREVMLLLLETRIVSAIFLPMIWYSFFFVCGLFLFVVLFLFSRSNFALCFFLFFSFFFFLRSHTIQV